MRKAVIDLGTNTFNLLVADVSENEFSIVHSEKEGVALGMGGINKNRLADESMARAIKTLRHFKQKCDALRVEHILAIGTSALRDAENQIHFVELVEREIGLKVQVISGLEEADLIFKGVKTICDFDSDAVIVDIGGGSTEFIYVNQQGVQKAISVNIGVSRIYQQFQFNDPISKDDEGKIIAFLEEKTAGRLDDWKCSTLIGSSGSFETFYELIHLRSFPKENEMIEISLHELNEVLDKLKQSTLAERNKNAFIIPIRKTMAPITAIETQWFMRKLGIEKILISPFALKEGALYKETGFNG